MLHSDKVNGDRTLDLHIRTKIVSYYSSIESAALRVGDLLVEIDAYKFYMSGTEFDDDALPFTTDEFIISAPVVGKLNRRSYDIVLNDKSVITVIKTKSFLSISVSGQASDFDESYGLLGDFHTGAAQGRDGRSMDQDWNAFGMEWQVRQDEPQLFRTLREPQLPYAKCHMPTAVQTKRRLRGEEHNPEFLAQAQEACTDAGDEFDACMSDVLGTGDLSFAAAW